LKNPAFVDKMKQLSGGEPSTSGLVTIKYSNWLMSIVLAQQPHFASLGRRMGPDWD
jgi:oleate hydratase